MEILKKKRFKFEYIFYVDRILKYKKRTLIKSIFIDEIEEIVYNPKFNFTDFVSIFINRAQSYYYLPKSLVIMLKSKHEILSIKLEKNEVEILKKLFFLDITEI